MCKPAFARIVFRVTNLTMRQEPAHALEWFRWSNTASIQCHREAATANRYINQLGLRDSGTGQRYVLGMDGMMPSIACRPMRTTATQQDVERYGYFQKQG